MVNKLKSETWSQFHCSFCHSITSQRVLTFMPYQSLVKRWFMQTVCVMSVESLWLL